MKKRAVPLDWPKPQSILPFIMNHFKNVCEKNQQCGSNCNDRNFGGREKKPSKQEGKQQTQDTSDYENLQAHTSPSRIIPDSYCNISGNIVCSFCDSVLINGHGSHPTRASR